MIETMSSNNVAAVKIIEGKKNQSKLIMLNQLELILDELFRIWHGRYQPTQLYLWVGFSSSA